MKLPTKPISSPGRAEKYPPPLMRFLRSNVGSRSRGRSRSSPMFVRKKSAANAAAPAIETQEPSSPKVTCMGQVRVSRSKTRPRKSKRRCKWIRNALFRRCLVGKPKPRCSKPDWRKWVMFFHCGFKRKSKIREDSSTIEPKFSNRSEDLDEEIEEEDERKTATATVTAKDYFTTAVPPPKNALFLTRSRSAPYRSSSLACRFWGSPLSNEEEKTEQKNTDEDEIPSPEREILRKEIKLDAESEEVEVPISSTGEKTSKIEEELRREDDRIEESVHPLILPRCKSEPARIGEKLDPELSFWKNGRLGFT